MTETTIRVPEGRQYYVLVDRFDEDTPLNVFLSVHDSAAKSWQLYRWQRNGNRWIEDPSRLVPFFWGGQDRLTQRPITTDKAAELVRSWGGTLPAEDRPTP